MKINHKGITLVPPSGSDDETELLYMWYTIVVCQFNPSSTSYQAGSPPVATVGMFPSYADEEYRYVLMQAHQQITITSDQPNGGNISLQSQAPEFETNASNGPFPIACPVGKRKVALPNSFRIRFLPLAV